MNKTNAMAYTEVLEILKYLPKEEYSKIPKEKIEYYENNKDENYPFKYDITKSLKEQNVSRKTNSIIVSLFINYFATSKQNEKIENILKQNDERHQKLLREKYNPDNIFVNKKQECVKNEIEEYKKIPWYKSVFLKLKNWLKCK